MYLDLSRYLELPPAYTQSDASIWTDEHISKQLLSAHLNPNYEGASRSHAFIDRSVSWIKETLPPSEYPRLLDVGCGPGLYAERFCQADYKVTGLDFSKRSIEYATGSAKESGLDIQYIHQDYLQMNLDGPFHLATLIYCDYGALSGANRAKLLQNIHHCLAPGGKLLLDVFSMEQSARFQEAREWENHPDGGFWSREPYLELNTSCRYGENLTMRQTVIVTEQGVRRFCLWDTYFTQEALSQEAQAAGFQMCDVFGDVSGTPYTEESPTIAILLQK